ncbi:MAG: NifB/NifX family molybdenum-iron cluster-binding protein [Candidatus Thermoplasmatota archaeon]|nr:NifB/NifX family molybdenum-iron cluster-binding protein [Candidatus Thermoplasmatota archaeon]
MKIGISSTGEDLNSNVDQRFGRCPYFLIVDMETMNFEAIPNEKAMASGGAGIQAAQMLARAGIKAVITGNAGPNAFRILKSAGIKVVTGVSGTVKEAVEKYKKGEFQGTDAPSVDSHFGMGQGAGSRSDL